jgi:septal ring factor EnvC (AmiA/AmiB activator)
LQNKGIVALSLLEAERWLTQASSTALDEFRAEVAEANAKLERLEEKLQDLETEKSEVASSIEASQRTLHIQKNSTQAEAFRLKGTHAPSAEVSRAIFLTLHVQMNSLLWKNFIFGILPGSTPISSNSYTHLASTFASLAPSSSL